MSKFLVILGKLLTILGLITSIIFGIAIIVGGIYGGNYLRLKYGLPVGFIYFFVVFILFLIGLSIVSLFKVAKTNTLPREINNSEISRNLDPDEKLVGYIPGVTFNGSRPLQISAKISIFDVGTVIRSENAILVSNKRLLFITVPLPGAGKIIGWNFTMLQWFFAKKDMSKYLEELLATMTLKDIAGKYCNFALNFNDVEEMRFIDKFLFINSKNIRFNFKDGTVIQYIVGDLKEFNKSKDLLKTTGVKLVFS